MSYLQPPFPFSAGPAAVPLDSSLSMDSTMLPPTMMHPLDGYMYPYPSFDPVDFYAQPIMDYDEYAENLSRPRLTKDQVETLEAQFQAHPKPNSNVKRQLAAQTNLSLPRVANWFQNRRAKAKQQRRQEEFAKSQKSADSQKNDNNKNGSSHSANNNSNTTNNHNNTSDNNLNAASTPKGVTTDSSISKGTLTPKQSSGPTRLDDHARTPTSSSPGSVSQKLRTESSQEATLESLQKALNVAVAANNDPSNDVKTNDHFGPADVMTPASSTTATTLRAKDGKRSFSEWESLANPSSTVWTPSHSPEHSFPYNNLSTTSFASSTESLPIPELDAMSHQSRGSDDAYLGLPYMPPAENWSGYLHTPTGSFSGPSSGTADPSYNTIPYTPSSLQPPAAPVSRRGSSDDLADSMENVGIDATRSFALHQLPQRVDGGAASWRIPGQKVDLAARRKRPRPAAIGTTTSGHHHAVGGPSTMSPTTRMPSFSANQGVKHSKSAQCLNSRYAGVRKASATPRSPFSRPNLSEAGTLRSKAEMPKKLRPSVSTNNLAPSATLTPEDFPVFHHAHHHPSTSSDPAFYYSGQPSDPFFTTSVSQPTQVTMASPPSTPLPMGAVPSFGYQNLAPPMSAPPQYTNFEYAPRRGSSAMGGWAETTPEDVMFQHPALAPPADIPPIYEPVFGESAVGTGGVPFSSSSPLDTSVKDAACPIRLM